MKPEPPPECKPTVKKLKKQGMEYVGYTSQEGWGSIKRESDSELDWIEIPDEFQLSGSRGEYIGFTGDTFVYRIVSDGAGGGFVFRQLKSEHFETTNDEGTCPNCQEYVRRMEGDETLTCHRCGWEYNPSLMDRMRDLSPL